MRVVFEVEMDLESLSHHEEGLVHAGMAIDNCIGEQPDQVWGSFKRWMPNGMHQPEVTVTMRRAEEHVGKIG